MGEKAYTKAGGRRTARRCAVHGFRPVPSVERAFDAEAAQILDHDACEVGEAHHASRGNGAASPRTAPSSDALAPAPFAPPLVVASSQSLRRGRSRLPRLRWSNAARHHRKDTRTGGRGARRSPTAITLATAATRPARARLRRSLNLAPARAHVRLETRSASPRLRHRDVRVGVSGVPVPRGPAPADRSGLDELDPKLRTLLWMSLALSGVPVPRGPAPADRSGLDELDPELRTLLWMSLAPRPKSSSTSRGRARSSTADWWSWPRTHCSRGSSRRCSAHRETAGRRTPCSSACGAFRTGRSGMPPSTRPSRASARCSIRPIRIAFSSGREARSCSGRTGFACGSEWTSLDMSQTEPLVRAARC